MLRITSGITDRRTNGQNSVFIDEHDLHGDSNNDVMNWL